MEEIPDEKMMHLALLEILETPRGTRDESTTVTCSDCGTECTVPFVPRTNKPVYCSDCFRQHKPQDSGNDGYSQR